ncbi:hypothetical protein G4V62_04515 [Bacillaceae bacterium SIJ1]|nr:hypothetical protein [Litoribacterium kuwaitense]
MKGIIIGSVLCTSVFAGGQATGEHQNVDVPKSLDREKIESILENHDLKLADLEGKTIKEILAELKEQKKKPEPEPEKETNKPEKPKQPEKDTEKPEESEVENKPEADKEGKEESEQVTQKPDPVTPPQGNGNTNPSEDQGETVNAELTAEEQQMLSLVNEARQAQGLQPLKADAELTKVARVKAQDMIDNNYFAHQSPTYGSPFDMMKQFGVTYRTAGENLAGNQTVEKAHTALMNSQGHRENILKSEYTNVGIGIVDGGPYGKMFVQLFKG